MTLRTGQVLAALLAATAGYIGMEPACWPRSLFDGFPGPGRHWVTGLGPYNEHLVRDVGALYPAMGTVWGTVCLGAALPAHSGLFTAAGLGRLAFHLPHAVFHTRHQDMYGPADTAGDIVALWGVVVLAALLPAPAPRRS